MTYDTWKATNPDDEWLGPEPPPCERPTRWGRSYEHPRFPSGYCTVCGAEAHQACKYYEERP